MGSSAAGKVADSAAVDLGTRPCDVGRGAARMKQPYFGTPD